MKTKALIIIFFALMLSAAAVASEKQRHVQIHVDAQDGHDTDIQSFRFDSDDAGFDLEELQLGESRAYVDEDGNNLFVVRTEDGFDFDLNGHKISLPDFTNDEMMFVRDGNDAHGEKQIIRKMKMIKIDSNDFGIDFTDDMEIHELHEIRIVREEVDVTN
jgi:hypothetical protein